MKLAFLLAALTATSASEQWLKGSEQSEGPIAQKRSKKSSPTAFSAACLRGRFGYFNLAGNLASLSSAVFDGAGGITDMSPIVTTTGGSLTFNEGSYEVYEDGTGEIVLNLSGAAGQYEVPPFATFKFVVMGVGKRCEITEINSFLTAPGVNEQIVAPNWRKI